MGAVKRSSNFYSLSWKIFVYLLIVLAGVHLAFSFYSQHRLYKFLDQEAVESSNRDIYVLEGLVANSYDRLLETGEMISLLLTSRRMVNNPNNPLLRYLPTLVAQGALDALYLYNEEQLQLQSQGVPVNLPAKMIRQVIRTEEPVRHLYCNDVCLRYVALPISLGEGKVGVLAVGREMRDIILEFKEQTGNDIGLVLSDSSVITEKRWLSGLKYLTHRANNLEILEQLFKQQTPPAIGGAFELEYQDKIYHILLQTPVGAETGSSYWVVVKDRTKQHLKAKQEFEQNITVVGIGLLIAAIIQLLMLRVPLKHLSEITHMLPLLATSAFDELRFRMGKIVRSNRYLDEIDLLKGSTLELTDQLERMERSLLERAQNLTERSEQLETERDFITNLLDTAEAIILTMDNDGRIVSINRFGQRVLGLSALDAKGKSFIGLDHDKSNLSRHYQLLQRIHTGVAEKEEIQAGFVTGSGDHLQISWLHSALMMPGSESAILSIGMDLTERTKAEQRLMWLAKHDSLTALPNRLMFTESLAEAIRYASKDESMVAVLFCDLDGFKDVNDSLGHPVGDELLKQATERMLSIIQGQGLLARQGGDEFTVLMPGLSDDKPVHKIIQEMLIAFRKPFLVDGYEVFNTLSIGVSLFPDHGDNEIVLLQHADLAMFEAKEEGKNQSRFYHDEKGSQRYERFSLINDLRKALDQEEFVIHYQPQVDARTGSVMGVEALIRWHHPTAGMVSPAKFIPLAEEFGLIVPIGEWVMNEACRMGKQWHNAGLPLRIGVNLAGQQIMHESLLASVELAIEASGINTHLLDLEVTENFLLRQPEIAVPKLHHFREMGVSLSMDDFGTGYSSLSYLKKLPLNTLKIDQSFVRDIGLDPEGEAIVRAIIALAKSLNLAVLAEGVETSEQLSYLRQHGCHNIQGYYFSKPLPASELPEYVSNQAVEITFE